jgi:hypothetical protein
VVKCVNAFLMAVSDGLWYNERVMTSFTVINDRDRYPDAETEDANRMQEADKSDTWIPMEEVHAKARKKA